jgi:hypothetical protein
LKSSKITPALLTPDWGVACVPKVCAIEVQNGMSVEEFMNSGCPSGVMYCVLPSSVTRGAAPVQIEDDVEALMPVRQRPR